jgi:hypothetical protein
MVTNAGNRRARAGVKEANRTVTRPTGAGKVGTGVADPPGYKSKQQTTEGPLYEVGTLAGRSGGETSTQPQSLPGKAPMDLCSSSAIRFRDVLA